MTINLAEALARIEALGATNNTLKAFFLQMFRLREEGLISQNQYEIFQALLKAADWLRIVEPTVYEPHASKIRDVLEKLK